MTNIFLHSKLLSVCDDILDQIYEITGFQSGAIASGETKDGSLSAEVIFRDRGCADVIVSYSSWSVTFGLNRKNEIANNVRYENDGTIKSGSIQISAHNTNLDRFELVQLVSDLLNEIEDWELTFE